MSKKDKLISVDHLKWNVGGIKCGTLTVDYLNWILDHEEPAVDAVPVRHGKWIPHEDEDGEHYGDKCSECSEWYVMPYGKTNFCPNCGARMDAKND